MYSVLERYGFSVNDISKLREYCRDFSIELTDHQLEQFQQYYELLIEWNEKMNLTSITEFDDVLKKHFLDSLSLVKADQVDLIGMICEKDSPASKDLHKKLRLLDIGTGAGFPAIPLKIGFPDLSVTMLDSLNKRIRFLDEVIAQLDLQDIAALHGRAEDYAGKSSKSDKEDRSNLFDSSDKTDPSDQKDLSHMCCRENFDIVVSRAVANLATLSEYCLPYVKEGGIFVAYKSEELVQEQKNAEHAISILGGKIEEVIQFTLPYTEFHRSLCVIRKVRPTPKKYPRKAGTPAKEPLK